MTELAKKYLDDMDNAIGILLIEPDGIYFGKEGHERFSRECGYALNDFDESDRTEIISKMPEKIHSIMQRSALDSDDLSVVLGCMV